MLELFRASYHLKSASSTLGLLGGDLGEPPVGVFLQVEERDIMAEEMGETLDQSQMRTPGHVTRSPPMRAHLAEERADCSRAASFSILT